MPHDPDVCLTAVRNYNPSSSRSYFGGLHNSGVLRLRNLTLLEFVTSLSVTRASLEITGVLLRIRWGIGVP
uniref:Uncharacterized protein n=1 Tax=Magallana gigas TaxID=29159 RepID=K1QV21_MAGGI